MQIFDEERVVAHPELSLAAGAIRSWDKRNPYYWHFVTSLAEHSGFDPDKPFNKLAQKVRRVLLLGSGEARTEFRHHDHRGRVPTDPHQFEGLVPKSERRYHENASAAMREEPDKTRDTKANGGANDRERGY